MLKRTIAAVFASALLLCGQEEPGNTGIAIYPPPMQAFEELKQYVGLSDAQLEQLRSLLNEKTTAQQEVYRQIAVKQTELNTLLSGGSRDVSRIGQLTLDVHTLSTQAPPSADTWRQRALAILTPDQRTKLVPLDQAIKLSSPAYQAVMFTLIDAPAARPVPMPTPRPTAPAPGTPVPLPTPVP